MKWLRMNYDGEFELLDVTKHSMMCSRKSIVIVDGGGGGGVVVAPSMRSFYTRRFNGHTLDSA